MDGSVGKFTFYRSFHAAIEAFDDATYGRYVRMLANYAFNGVEPQLNDSLMVMFWTMAKPLIDKTIIRSVAGRTGGQNGSGIPRNEGNNNAAKQKQNNSKTIAKQKQNKSDARLDIDNDSDSDIDNIDNSLRSLSNKELDKKSEIENLEIAQSDTLDTSASGETQPEKKRKEPEDLLATAKNRSEEYDAIMHEWIEYKKQRKDKLTVIGIGMAYAKLIRLSEGNSDQARAIIEDAIANGYQGFYELNKNRRGSNSYRHPTVLDQSQMKYKPF